MTAATYSHFEPVPVFNASICEPSKCRRRQEILFKLQIIWVAITIVGFTVMLNTIDTYTEWYAHNQTLLWRVELAWIGGLGVSLWAAAVLASILARKEIRAAETIGRRQ